MFERFTQEARQVVLGAVTAAEQAGADRVDTGHLLAALADDPGPAGEALAAAGVTADRVRGDLARPAPLDPAALRALGIDYDEVRRAVEAEFGAGALDRVLGRGRRRRHVPFAPEGRQALGQALRAVTAARGRRIGAEHVLLGALDVPGSRAVGLLTGYGVDVDALRTTLRTPTRRAS